MYDKTKDKKAVDKMTFASREMTLRLSMSGALSYAIWVDFYSILRKHQDIYKFSLRQCARNINKWFEEHDKKWSENMSGGFYYAVSDFYYEDTKEIVDRLHKKFEDNYKDATMKYYELLGWTQLISYLIQYSDLLFIKSISNVKNAYGIDVTSGYKDYNFKTCKAEMDNLYDLIWKRVKTFHTKPNIIVNHNSQECQDISKELISTLDDKDWIKERLRKAKLVYNTNMYGYAELG